MIVGKKHEKQEELKEKKQDNQAKYEEPHGI